MLAGCLLVGGVARADEPDRPDEADAPRQGAFDLRFDEMYVGIEAEYEQRRVRSARKDRRDAEHRNRDFLIIENFGLRFSGDAISPEVLSFQGGVELGLTQSRFYEQNTQLITIDRSESDSGLLLEYDFSMQAFQNKPISINAYARRVDDRIPRRFLPSLDETRTEAGVAALLNKGPFQLEFGYAYEDVNREGNRREIDDERYRDSRFYADARWDIADNHQLKLSFDHEREHVTYQGSAYEYTTNRDEFRLDHNLQFGEDNRHRLDTFFRYSNEEGDLARDEIQFTPRLLLQHTDRFQTAYRYGYYRLDQGEVRVDQHKFDLEAIYRPIDDLSITLDGYGLYERVDQGVETYEWGAGINLDYQRETPVGELLANAAFSFDRARTVGDAGSRVVRDEAHRLTDVRPVFLSELGAQLTSVVAHNQARTRYFTPGIDYLITIVGGRAMITRVRTGRIDPDEIVYFDYAYYTSAQATVDTYRVDVLLEHRFQFGLTPYYAFEGRFQNAEGSRGTPVYRDNTDRHRMGVRYQKDRFSLGTEYEIFDDTIEPYDAMHFTGQVAIFREPDHALDFNAELSRYFFEGGFDDRNVTWIDLYLTDRLQLTREFSMITTTRYHWEDDSVDGETNGVDLEWGLRFARGYLSVDLTLEYDLLSIIDDREDGFGVYLQVRRDLSHLLRPRRGETR